MRETGEGIIAAMTEAAHIRQVSDEIARRFRPQRIVFGSHAYGTPGPDSDVDLLVVMSLPGGGRGRGSVIRQTLDIAFPLDLIVCDPDYLRQRLSLNDFFCRKSPRKAGFSMTPLTH